jgi:alpha-aminoadipic semialdehyde synthase
VGIRRETKDPTEARVPLTPTHVKKIVENHKINIFVQPSEKRVFKDLEYEKAGANLTDDLSKCDIIFGVKEVPMEELQPNTTYCFFSHTIKGQTYNMPMLQKILDDNITLIDYELIKDETNHRLVFFGDFAGYAGMINSLWVLGQRLKHEGFDTPFAEIKQAKEYGSLREAEESISKVGEEIKKKALPDDLQPFITVFTGYGNVSKGAQHIYNLLPVVEIHPEDVKHFSEVNKYANNAVFKSEFRKPHLYKPKKENAKFNLTEFGLHPDRYANRFEEFIPHLSMIINGIYWEPSYPPLLTKKYTRELYNSSVKPKLKVIGDITCDIGGSIELTEKPANSLNPCYVYDFDKDQIIDGWEGNGPVIMAVDKLPTELPREASESFGDALYPFVSALVNLDFTKSFAKLDLPLEISKAVITHKGKLTNDYKYLETFLRDHS